jgi:glycerate 2-kinase
MASMIMDQSLKKLRSDLLSIAESAIASVSPYDAILGHLSLHNYTLSIDKERVYLENYKRIFILGAGKASLGMAAGLEKILGDKISGGLITAIDGQQSALKRVKTITSAHPIPDQGSLMAASKTLEIAASLGAHDLAICLLSGGASAMWAKPAGNLTREDKIRVNRALINSGANIAEINTVRKHISAIKGGNLAKAAYPATTIALVISDVFDNDLGTIASGPTAPDPTTFRDAVSIIEKYGLRDKIPDSVMGYLKSGSRNEIPETPKPGDKIFDRVTNFIIAENRRALEAASITARQLGYNTYVIPATVVGEARDAGRDLAKFMLRSLEAGKIISPPAVIISGGETTVTVRGKGKGGRNQELALSAGLEIDGRNNMVFASIGTDGIDGPTDAAGAMVDGGTINRGNAAGMQASQYLSTNNSYAFFEKLGDLIKTGPTGTNVMDMQLAVIGGQKEDR